MKSSDNQKKTFPSGWWLSQALNSIDKFKLKVILLATTFLSMSSCLVIWRPLKMAVFAKVIGPTYMPDAKIYSLGIIIPLIIVYSCLVDLVRRHHLLYCFTIGHAIGGLVFYYFFIHPVHGIANTTLDSSRWIGWAFYFFMESFDAFFSTSFWAFADSISKPKDAKNYYGFLVAGSKIGGILAAGMLYCLLTLSDLSSTVLLPTALLTGSAFLLTAAGCIYLLIKNVPEEIMHGYESVYQLEKKRESQTHSLQDTLKNIFVGPLIIIRSSYVLGIFCLGLFYEIIISIFDYIVMLQANTLYPTIGNMTAFYAFYYLMMNIIGLAISLLGTTPLLRLFSLRISLLAFPLTCLILLLCTWFFPLPWVLVFTLMSLRALNYALNHPTKEVLYIPTTKDIKFKAKAWADAFGSRIAKSIGSLFNKVIDRSFPAYIVFSGVGVGITLTMFWLITVYFLGKRLQGAIDNKEVIGNTQE